MLVNLYGTHRAPPPLVFPHVLHSRRDRSDPALAPHLHGFAGFVTDRGRRPMSAARYDVLRHLKRVRHHVALEVEPPHLDALTAWATAANAIAFLPDGTVRAPDGAIIVDPATGDAHPGADVPFLADALERRDRTRARLDALGIATPAALPPVVAADELELRTAPDVATRSHALVACALRAESLAARRPLSRSDLEARWPGAAAAMSPRERAFFEADSPTDQEVVDHAWRYEALAALLWALGHVDDLGLPTQICEVPAIARTMLERDEAAFIGAARLRAAPDILDALDLHVRAHWATSEARLHQVAPPADLEPGVVHERHHALNWLTRFEDADWDDVSTPT
jgi:hypothetical protein